MKYREFTYVYTDGIDGKSSLADSHIYDINIESEKELEILASSLFDDRPNAAIMELTRYANGKLRLVFKDRKRRIIYQVKPLKFIQQKLFDDKGTNDTAKD